MNPLAGNLAYLKQVENRLHAAKVRGARYEAESIVRHYGHMDRLDLFTGRKSLTPGAKLAVERAMRWRLRQGRPLQYILREAGFCGETLFVTPGALIPRPETELLVEEADRLIGQMLGPRPERVGSASSGTRWRSANVSPKTSSGRGPLSVLDLGTGSGCIALALTIRRPECKMTALDVSAAALAVARKNLKNKGLQKKVRLVRGDLFKPFKGKRAVWDLIVSNPPYIPRDEIRSLSREVLAEPRVALDGGRKGLEIIRRILTQAPGHLNSGGFLLMEIGKGQSRVLARETSGSGEWKSARFVKDLSGIARILVLEKK